MVVDRSRSSLQQLGITAAEAGNLRLLPGENLQVSIFVDVSVVEIFADNRFPLMSRVYPSLETSTAAAYDLNGFDEEKFKFECWQGWKNAWPGRGSGCGLLPELLPLHQKAQHKPLDKDGFATCSEMPLRMAAASCTPYLVDLCGLCKMSGTTYTVDRAATKIRKCSSHRALGAMLPNRWPDWQWGKAFQVCPLPISANGVCCISICMKITIQEIFHVFFGQRGGFSANMTSSVQLGPG